MADHSRLEDLRRRVQKDPASIAFAQLAEECRRAGEYQEAIDTCRAGLAIHPGYLSARVTLGRALVELGQLDEAQVELSRVTESAPENLAAIRGLAEIYHRRGDLAEALAQYRAALLLARNDPDLEETIDDLSRQVEPAEPAPAGGLSMQHMQDELLKLTPIAPKKGDRSHSPDLVQSGSAISADSAVRVDPPQDGTLTARADDRATRTVAALEQWLAAIHVSREERHA
jgi:tetratricopeptide (TPR) repeat protein